MNGSVTIYKKKTAVEDLLLLDIKSKSFSRKFEKYKASSGLMHIKGCSRSVLIGRLSALESIPRLDEVGVSVYEKTEAYSHLLSYVTGLLSRIRGENQIVSQFKRSYEELKGRDSSAAKHLNDLFQSILHDNGIIRNHVTKSLKPAFYEACAHELAEQDGHEDVLIVANTRKKGGGGQTKLQKTLCDILAVTEKILLKI